MAKSHFPSWIPTTLKNKNFLSGLGSFLGGVGINSGAPFSAAQAAYEKWAQMGGNAEQPYMEAGQEAIPEYEEWAHSMADPEEFTNQMMDAYQESPYAKFMQQQAVRSAQNAGSQYGMVGSSPYDFQVEQNAENISSQDLQNWMNHVMSLNRQYGGAEYNLMRGGQGSANQLLNLYGREAGAMGETAAGESAGQNANTASTIGGIAQMGEGLAHTFGF